MLETTRNAYGPNILARLLTARTTHQIDECAKAAWILNGAGLIGDAEMEYLSPVIEHQRRSNCIEQCSRRRLDPRINERRRRPIPFARRNEAWLKRRALAKNCIIPTCIAKFFTVSKLAVLAVIAQTIIDLGSSNMSLPEIAARAGVGCTTARYAIREAARMGLISVSENRCNATWSRPNTIRIVCARWRKWLAGHLKPRAKKTSESVPGTASATPLRNRDPTIEIKRFNLQSVAAHSVTCLTKASFALGTGCGDGRPPSHIDARTQFPYWTEWFGLLKKAGVLGLFRR